jgi:uncharacterized FlaG/YvyC family protein
MDVNFSSLPSLQTQTGAQSGSNSIPGGNSAVKTLQSNPDSVVSQSGQSAGPKTDSDRSLARESDRDIKVEKPPELKSAQQALDSLKSSNRSTQVVFNNETNRVSLKVVDTRTDQVIEQIPSEAFVKLIGEQLEPPVKRTPNEPNGAVIDEAI